MGYLSDDEAVERLLALGRGDASVTEAERRELAGHMITFAGELFAATGVRFMLDVGPEGVAIGFPAEGDRQV